MADLYISPSTLQGKIAIPSSKSHTLRAILFAALGHGTSHIDHALPSPDTAAMIDAARLLGARIEERSNEHSGNLIIHGISGIPKVAEDVIQCGNSGLVLRLIGALAGLIPHYTLLTGDASIRHNRPVKPLLYGLNQLGAEAHSARGDGFAPILIKGPFTKHKATIEGSDSQPVSGLLIAGALAPRGLELSVENPGEKPWVELTLSWFKKLNIPFEQKEHTHYRLFGNSKIAPFHYAVPGDFSTAAFPLAAALLTQSELTLENIDMSDVQGDKALLFALQQMGAKFTFRGKTLTVHKHSSLRGMKLDINDYIDALPILAVIGCFAEGTTEITGAANARTKESDRIASIAKELRKMGADIEEKPDGLLIRTSKLQGASLQTHHDHRLVLALSVAALAARGSSTIQGVECAAKTYPHFFEDFRSIGASIER